MALSRLTTWAKQTLTFQALNAEFNNILNNALSLISPLTGSLDANGNSIIMDPDGDSNISGATDDQIDFTLGGAAAYRMTATGLRLLSTRITFDADFDTYAYSSSDDELIIVAGGVQLFKFDGTTASSVNGLTFTGTSTGNNVGISAFGSDTDIGISLTPKGAGVVACSGGISVTGLLTGVVYNGSATWDPGSLASGAGESKDVTVTGAALGDFVLPPSFSLDVQDLTLSAQVTSANTVTCTLTNTGFATVNLDSGTVYVRVLSRA